MPIDVPNSKLIEGQIKKLWGWYQRPPGAENDQKKPGQDRVKIHLLLSLIKALLGMLARLPWGRRDMLSSMNGKYEGVSVKYASLIVSCHWINVFITS